MYIFFSKLQYIQVIFEVDSCTYFILVNLDIEIDRIISISRSALTQ